MGGDGKECGDGGGEEGGGDGKGMEGERQRESDQWFFE